jgi:GT2 family glycosyltransferase
MVRTEFPAVILIENKINMGFAAANNQAMIVARSQVILLLNSDTVVHGDVLARSVEYIHANSDVGVMGCRVLNTDGTVQATCSQFPTLLNLTLQTLGLSRIPWPPFFDRYQMRRWNRQDEREVDIVSGCYLVARASAIEKVGLLDESFFFFGEETDWCRRFQMAGWKLRFAPVGEITHHGGGSVRKLNYKRDLMLTSATIRLHLKHGGLLSAIYAWSITSIFNLSRAAYWFGRSIFSRERSVRERRDHFAELVINYRCTWPTKGIPAIER